MFVCCHEPNAAAPAWDGREGGRKGGRERGRTKQNQSALVFHITLLLGERGKKKVERGRRRSTSGASEPFNWEFMEAAVVKNEDLLRGLRSPGSSTA